MNLVICREKQTERSCRNLDFPGFELSDVIIHHYNWIKNFKLVLFSYFFDFLAAMYSTFVEICVKASTESFLLTVIEVSRSELEKNVITILV